MENSQKKALAKNETQYFTGKPCKYGHIAFRRAKSGECSTCRKIALKAWHDKNPHKAKQYGQEQHIRSYERRKSLIQFKAFIYRRTDIGKAKINARTVAYQAAKVNRTPKWLNEDHFWMMQQAYELAALRTKVFGFSWHVDHIIPLRGKTVSGLHVPWNLQVIPGIDNMKKANKHT